MKKIKYAYQVFGLSKKSSNALVEFMSIEYEAHKDQMLQRMGKIVKDKDLTFSARCFCSYLIGCIVGTADTQYKIKEMLRRLK